MAVALFINPDYIKKVSILDENVDEKVIRVCIKEAQDVRVHRILGSDLYNKYVTDINTSGSAGVTGVYKTLMDDYIINALTYWTLYEIALWLNYKYRNKAIAAQTSDNGQPVDLSTVQALRDEHKDKAEWYSQQLTKYLVANETSYPEYSANNDSNDIQPDGDNYDCAIYTKNIPYNEHCLEDRYKQL